MASVSETPKSECTVENQESTTDVVSPTPLSNTSLTVLPPVAATGAVPVSPSSIPTFTTTTKHIKSPATASKIQSPATNTSPQSKEPPAPVPETPKEVLLALWKVAIPAAGSSLFMMGPNLVMTALIGHRLGDGALSYWGLAITSFNLFGFSIAIGFICALDTFASQAFGRDPKSSELGILLQRTLCIVFGLGVIPAVLLLNSEPIVAALLNPTLAPGSSAYLRHGVPYFYGVLLNSSLMSCINACRLTQIPLYANIVGTVVNVVLSYYFLYSLPVVAYIQLAHIMAGNCVMLYYIKTHPDLVGIRAATWWPLSAIPREKVISMEHFKSYMKIGIPSMVAVCSEWWAFEAMIFFAAHISDESVGVLTVIFNIFTLFFLTSSGLSRGASIVIGNALGANKPGVAKMSMRCAVQSIIALDCVTATSIFLLGRSLWEFFTTDQEILKHATTWFILLTAACNFLDGIQFTLQGCFRGVGRQGEAAKAALCSLWMVGVLGAFYLGLRLGFGVEGVIFGLFCGLLVETPLFAQSVLKWDWAKLAKEAVERSVQVEEEVSEPEVAIVVEGDSGSPQFPATVFDETDDQHQA